MIDTADPAKVQALDALMQAPDIDIEPVTSPQTGIAREAYRIYGKGHHPAGQNYKNRFAYALTKAPGQRLLFKRLDFPQNRYRCSVVAVNDVLSMIGLSLVSLPSRRYRNPDNNNKTADKVGQGQGFVKEKIGYANSHHRH